MTSTPTAALDADGPMRAHDARKRKAEVFLQTNAKVTVMDVAHHLGCRYEPARIVLDDLHRSGVVVRERPATFPSRHFVYSLRTERSPESTSSASVSQTTSTPEQTEALLSTLRARDERIEALEQEVQRLSQPGPAQ